MMVNKHELSWRSIFFLRYLLSAVRKRLQHHLLNTDDFKDLIGKVSLFFCGLSVESEIKIFQARLIDRQRKGSVEENEWTLSSAFLFSLTVITTIGKHRSRRKLLFMPIHEMSNWMDEISTERRQSFFLFRFNKVFKSLLRNFFYISSHWYFCVHCRLWEHCTSYRTGENSYNILRHHWDALVPSIFIKYW